MVGGEGIIALEVVDGASETLVLALERRKESKEFIIKTLLGYRNEILQLWI